MDRTFIFASHGILAQGIEDAVKLILGDKQNIKTLCAYVDETDLEEQVEEILRANGGPDTIVITDIFGGSVNNAFMQRLDTHEFHLIAGLNLPLVVELMMDTAAVDTRALIEKALGTSKDSICYLNEEVICPLKTADEEF